jgi:hypothetical protein
MPGRFFGRRGHSHSDWVFGRMWKWGVPCRFWGPRGHSHPDSCQCQIGKWDPTCFRTVPPMEEGSVVRRPAAQYATLAMNWPSSVSLSGRPPLITQQLVGQAAVVFRGQQFDKCHLFLRPIAVLKDNTLGLNLVNFVNLQKPKPLALRSLYPDCKATAPARQQPPALSIIHTP